MGELVAVARRIQRNGLRRYPRSGWCVGESLSASVADPSGATIAGLNGHTWGGCCEILNVWVHESRRGAGIGRALIEAAEAEAIRRGCTQIVLSTHSFQAPGFYERLGFERIGVIPDYPAGHQNLVYLKRLRSDG